MGRSSRQAASDISWEKMAEKAERDLEMRTRRRDSYSAPRGFGMISVQIPTSLCMQNKLIIHSRYCFVEQYVYPREPNIYIGNLYLRDE